MSGALIMIQVFFSIVIGLYFLNLLKSQQENKVAVERESKKEVDKLKRMREISLTEPLSEKTRPKTFDDIIGQTEGIKALKAALCGPNPQHVIVYGPPGIGKTAAARLVLEKAKNTYGSPFKKDAKFIEMDATCVRFDERSIADPLIGSVHDPIYQGAGAMGVAGIPQPKPGAVTKAHGGVLFLDEIGELHPIQMNKLLKVLEDRKVFLESAYYSSEDKNIPRHIHDIFTNGLPADFRLIGATTKSSGDISPAIRSRCLEIFFRPLLPDEIKEIARNASQKGGFQIEEAALDVISKYATNGREAVNIIQLAGGVVLTEGRNNINQEDTEWVINSGHYSPRPEKKINDSPLVGYANGLAVYGPNIGTLIEVEASALPVIQGKGNLVITGIVDEEEIGSETRRFRRRSTAKGSVDNVLTVLRKYMQIDPNHYDIHLNLPGGIPVDGPSAGITIAAAIYSAITNKPVDNKVAMTGEVSITGKIKAIGGITAKIEAAIHAEVSKVIIPEENWRDNFSDFNIRIIPVKHIKDAINEAIYSDDTDSETRPQVHNAQMLSASTLDVNV